LGAGYSSFADVVSARVPDDQRLRQYADAYKRKVVAAKKMCWSGLVIFGVGDLACLAIALANLEDLSTAARISVLICGGIGIGGATASLVAALSPGGPKELVDYYNKTYAEK
jgi:MFS family permease